MDDKLASIPGHRSARKLGYLWLAYLCARTACIVQEAGMSPGRRGRNDRLPTARRILDHEGQVMDERWKISSKVEENTSATDKGSTDDARQLRAKQCHWRITGHDRIVPMNIPRRRDLRCYRDRTLSDSYQTWQASVIVVFVRPQFDQSPRYRPIMNRSDALLVLMRM